MGPALTATLMMPAFSNLDAFIGYYEKLEENTDLVVLAALPRVGLTAGDTVLMRLPGALQGLIVNSPRTDLLGGQHRTITLRAESLGFCMV